MLLGCGQGGRLVEVLLNINPFPRSSVNWCQEASATRYVSLWGGGGAFSERIPPGQYGGRMRERKGGMEEKWENEREEERGKELGGDRGTEKQGRTKKKQQERERLL